ncbi:MAG: helix-turn-helix domain-containing protein [Candidatus Woesearchaeota archaeon]|nr:MAG: helix-turn-helix domain-containing protein [Candidatus Woesearchaeota archaeon]
MMQPREVEVFYIIPALRRELTKALITKNNLSQKQAAKILGLTEAAISQYLNEKRASEVNFTPEITQKINEAAIRLKQNNFLVMKEINDLCEAVIHSKVICNIHKTYDKSLNTKVCEHCLGG